MSVIRSAASPLRVIVSRQSPMKDSSAFPKPATLLADPFVDDVPPTIRLLILLAAQGALIWLFAAWRQQRAPWRHRRRRA
jgi:hypothetical protein